MESLMHQLRIEQARSIGYEKNGFAAEIKKLAVRVAGDVLQEQAEALIEWISIPPVRRPDAFKIISEERTVVALEVVHSHGIKDTKAIWYARLHEHLIDLGWELNVEIADAVTGKAQIVDHPYSCWGLLILMSGPAYDPKKGIHQSMWPHLRWMGLTP